MLESGDHLVRQAREITGTECEDADHSPQEIADMVMVELDRLAISDGERR